MKNNIANCYNKRKYQYKKQKNNYRNFKPAYYDMRNFSGPKPGDKYI